MGIKRSVDTGIWTNPYIVDNFSVDDRLFWAYALTNSHNLLCGVAKLSAKTISYETGFSVEVAKVLIERFRDKYQFIDYDEATSEMLIVNWHKFNWQGGDKFLVALDKSIQEVKTPRYIEYLQELSNYIKENGYPIDSLSIAYRWATISISNTKSKSNTKTNTKNNKNNKTNKTNKEEKKPYGEFQNVLLTDEEYKKLTEKFGDKANDKIENLSIGIASKKYKYSSHYATILSWDRKEKRDTNKGVVKTDTPTNQYKTKSAEEYKAGVTNW